MDDIVMRLRTSPWLKGSPTGDMLLEAAAEIERLRQGIWDACRILGMDTDGNATPHARTQPHLADLIVQEAQRTTTDSQEEVERLQAIEDANVAEIERLLAEVARLGAFLHPIGEKARRG